jgi:hypothetical protein
MRQGGGCRARCELDQLPEPVLPVEAQDPELFDLQAPDIGSHVSRNRSGAVEHRCLPGWRFDHAPGDFDECGQLPGLGLPDALQPPEVLRLPTGESGDGPGLGDQLRGESKDGMAVDARMEHEGDQLGVAEGSCPKRLKPLLRLFAHCHRELVVGCVVAIV